MILLAGLIGSPRPTTNFPQGDQPPREQLNEKSEYNQSGSKLVTSVRIECDPNCSKSDSDEEANSVYITRLFKKFFSDPVAILTLPIMLANIVLVLIVRGLRILAKPPTDSGINPPGDSGDKSPTNFGVMPPGGHRACWL